MNITILKNPWTDWTSDTTFKCDIVDDSDFKISDIIIIALLCFLIIGRGMLQCKRIWCTKNKYTLTGASDNITDNNI